MIVYLHHQNETKIRNFEVGRNSINILKYTIMARLYETVQLELENARQELVEVETMSEKEVCYKYDVDSRDEAIEIINEGITALERESEYLMPDNLYDSAIEIFGSYEAMNSFLY